MTDRTNNFEGGTDGVAVSTGNSGGASGDAFSSVWSTLFKYSAADAVQGSMGAAVVGDASLGGAGAWTLSTPSSCALKMKFKMKTLATGDTYLMRIHNGATRVFSIHINAAGKLRVDDAAGTAGTFTFTNVLTAGSVYRLEAFVIAGSTSSNGTIKVGYYLGNSTTPVETVYLNTAANVGSGITFTTAYMGKYNASPEAYGFDEFAERDPATDFIGVGAGSPPTVSTPANQNVSAGASVTAAVTASSGSGTITGYAWSKVYPSSGGPTLSGTTTNTVSFTAGAAGDLVILQCVVTDSNSLTTTVTTEVRVPTSADASFLPGAAATSVGAWSNVGGASTVGDAASDGSDTTYVESTTLSASAVSERIRLRPLTARSALSVVARLAQDTSGSTTVKVRLFEGTTQRQEWTQAVTTAFADYTLAVTTPGAITDWGNLYLEFVGTAP